MASGTRTACACGSALAVVVGGAGGATCAACAHAPVLTAGRTARAARADADRAAAPKKGSTPRVKTKMLSPFPAPVYRSYKQRPEPFRVEICPGAAIWGDSFQSAVPVSICAPPMLEPGDGEKPAFFVLWELTLSESITIRPPARREPYEVGDPYKVGPGKYAVVTQHAVPKRGADVPVRNLCGDWRALKSLKHPTEFIVRASLRVTEAAPEAGGYHYLFRCTDAGNTITTVFAFYEDNKSASVQLGEKEEGRAEVLVDACFGTKEGTIAILVAPRESTSDPGEIEVLPYMGLDRAPPAGVVKIPTKFTPRGIRAAPMAEVIAKTKIGKSVAENRFGWVVWGSTPKMKPIYYFQDGTKNTPAEGAWDERRHRSATESQQTTYTIESVELAVGFQDAEVVCYRAHNPGAFVVDVVQRFGVYPGTGEKVREDDRRRVLVHEFATGAPDPEFLGMAVTGTRTGGRRSVLLMVRSEGEVLVYVAEGRPTRS